MKKLLFFCKKTLKKSYMYFFFFVYDKESERFRLKSRIMMKSSLDYKLILMLRLNDFV